MSICEWLSDRMPSVALGQAEWSPEEARHLNECTACQAEWKLVQTARRLGRAGGLVRDPDATASAVIQRLARPERPFPIHLWGFPALAAAMIAAVVWVGGGGTPADPAPDGTSVAAELPMPLPELEALQPAELDSVLQTMDDSTATVSEVDGVGLGDLDTEELQRVLDTWEG